MRVAFVSAEAAPWAKTGGLGDVVGSLPAALRAVQPDVQVVVFSPLYKRSREALAKRAMYRRTVREIEALPVELAIEDMGINPYQAREIARKAVYGA